MKIETTNIERFKGNVPLKALVDVRLTLDSGEVLTVSGVRVKDSGSTLRYKAKQQIITSHAWKMAAGQETDYPTDQQIRDELVERGFSPLDPPVTPDGEFTAEMPVETVTSTHGDTERIQIVSLSPELEHQVLQAALDMFLAPEHKVPVFIHPDNAHKGVGPNMTKPVITNRAEWIKQMEQEYADWKKSRGSKKESK